MAKLQVTVLKGWQFWLLNGAALLAAVLLVAFIVLYQSNRGLAREVQQRNQFIQQTVPLGKLNNEMIKALAAMAAQQEDPALKQLLVEHGIRYQIQTTPAATAVQGAEEQ